MTDCPFCRRIERDEYDEHLSDEHAVCFEPLNPVAPGHLLVVSRYHSPDAGSMPTVYGNASRLAAQIAFNLGEYNLITSAGAAATQTIRHLHIHLVPRRAGDGLKLPWTDQQRVPPLPD